MARARRGNRPLRQECRRDPRRSSPLHPSRWPSERGALPRNVPAVRFGTRKTQRPERPPQRAAHYRRSLATQVRGPPSTDGFWHGARWPARSEKAHFQLGRTGHDRRSFLRHTMPLRLALALRWQRSSRARALGTACNSGLPRAGTFLPKTPSTARRVVCGTSQEPTPSAPAGYPHSALARSRSEDASFPPRSAQSKRSSSAKSESSASTKR